MLAGGLLPVDPVGGAPTAQLAAIQGNVPRARNLSQQLSATQVTQNHVEATLKLAAQVKAGQRPAPDLVIWPENSTDLDPFQNPVIYAELSTAVNAIGRPVLVGEVLNDPRRNVGQLWLPGRGPTDLLRQAPAGAVRRVHPVPRLHLQLQRPAGACSRSTSPPATGPSCSASGRSGWAT